MRYAATVVLEIDTFRERLEVEHLLALSNAMGPFGSVGRWPPMDTLRLVFLQRMNAKDALAAADLGHALARHAVAEGLGTEHVDAAVLVRVVVEPATESDARTERVLDRFDQLPPLVSVTEAAEILGLTPAGVRYRAERGQHGARKVGDIWVFPRFHVEADAAERAYRE